MQGWKRGPYHHLESRHTYVVGHPPPNRPHYFAQLSIPVSRKGLRVPSAPRPCLQATQVKPMPSPSCEQTGQMAPLSSCSRVGVPAHSRQLAVPCSHSYPQQVLLGSAPLELWASGKPGRGNSGVACRSPGSMRDFSGCSWDEDSLLIQKRFPREKRATNSSWNLHKYCIHLTLLTGLAPEPSGFRPAGRE